MRKLFLLLLIVNTLESGYSQTIKGFVMDNSDKSKISYASIYINGTCVGTNSDKDGYFELNITKYNTLPLTISALGYYSTTLTDIATDKIIKVYLNQKTFELKEVVVETKSHEKERKTNLKLFRSQFLGLSTNGRKCVILNENDIKFVTSANSLKAFASKPIIILNYGLGYKITYYMDSFEFNQESGFFSYKGAAIFDENLLTGLSQKSLFEKRRKNAYLGSMFHFYRSLWANSLESNGFSIRNSEGEKINYENLVAMGLDSKKYITHKGRLYISYLSKPADSYIEFIKDKVFFDRVGYFDGSGVKIIGQMATQRIGDLLPYDYK